MRQNSKTLEENLGRLVQRIYGASALTHKYELGEGEGLKTPCISTALLSGKFKVVEPLGDNDCKSE